MNGSVTKPWREEGLDPRARAYGYLDLLKVPEAQLCHHPGYLVRALEQFPRSFVRPRAWGLQSDFLGSSPGALFYYL